MCMIFILTHPVRFKKIKMVKNNPLHKLIGKTFSRWTILEEEIEHISPKGRKYKKVRCMCECGNIRNVRLDILRSGGSKSCGCVRINKHGKYKSAEYAAWISMNQRCNNPKNRYYYNYGGRGISVCERWTASFESFYSDMGDRPTRYHSIERIDNECGYDPTNCKWATRTEQQHNTRLQVNNKTGVNGVRLPKQRKKYVANITVNSKLKYIGSFSSLTDAANARKEAEVQFWR